MPDKQDSSPLTTVARTYGFWGRHPAIYRILSAPTFLFRERLLRGLAVQGLNLHHGNAALEVACGTGLNLSRLRESVGEAGRVVGFDYSEEMLSAAKALVRAEGWRNVEFHRGDAAELAIPGGPFDGVLCILGMSAIPKRRAALERIHALLRIGGRLSVCDAQTFQGAWRFLNPIIRPLYGKTAAWDPDADIPSDIRSVFGNLDIRFFNGGSYYVATAEKQ